VAEPWETQARDADPASELLDVTNRAELEDFVRAFVSGSGERLPATAGQALVDVLTTTAVRTVPTLSALVGAGAAPTPQVYGLALEGMSAEDRDYELARQFVRFARAAADRVARTPDGVGTAVALAARDFAPGLAYHAAPAGKESRMFDTGTQTAEYDEAEFSRRRRRRWPDDEAGYGEGPYGEAAYGEGPYGETSYGEAPYGETQYGEAQYGEAPYGEGPYGETGYGESEHDEEDEEERFLPLIPLAGKVLGGLLGGLMKEEEEEAAYSEEGEAGEAEEEFLGRLLQKVLGEEAEHDEYALSPAQEAEFAGHMLQIRDEEELDHFLGGLVDFVGKAVQGVRGAARSPQGRALIKAIKPLAKAALPALGGAIGTAIAPGVGTQVGRTLGSAASSLFETEAMGSQEEEEFETARRFVRLASAAARDVACAPQGAPPQMVGEFGVIRASRQFARPLFGRALRRVSPFARRFFGRRYAGFRRRGFRFGRPFRPAPFRPRFGLRPRFGFGFPAAVDEPEPVPVGAPEPPGPPQPGFRWVAVPIGAPDPVPAAPPEPPPGDGAPAAQSEYGYGNGHGGNGHGGRWVRRDGKIIVLGA
jgi:hypothetical protein